MSYDEAQRPGDKVMTGLTRTGKVVKTKPDGTKIVKTKSGSLKAMKHPKKPVN